MLDFLHPDPHLNEIVETDDDTQIYLHKYKTLEDLSFNFERKSQDKKMNTNGFKLIELCKNNNLFSLNGRSSKDKDEGKFTFRDKSILDYVISTSDCFNILSHFEIIYTDPIFSDGRNILSWHLNLIQSKTFYSNETIKNINSRPSWVPSKDSAFVENIDYEHVNSLINQLNTYPQSQETIE